MCGVVARLGRIDRSFDEAVRRIEHRGIRTGVKSARCGAVGHARLPIVGLGEENDQPVAAMGWVIGFVGEILDYKETHPHLECDLPLVVEMWTTGRHDFRSRDGFWGIAAIHIPTSTLHVLCDYLAQKPMYYRTDFPSAASEPAALLPFGPVTWDEIYFSAVRKWGYCPDLTRTPWQEVKHVLPGEYVKIHENGYCVRESYDPLTPQNMSEAALQAEVEKAVRRRLMSSDVPVAALVSGGLDSSIVYTLAAHYGFVKAYHTTSSNGAFDPVERERAERLVLPPQEFAFVKTEWGHTDSVHSAVGTMQEPIDLGSLLPQLALSNAVTERVCLTGDGADELFGGYSRSIRYDSQASDIFHELPAWHLPRLDRVMMRQRIEVRSPFLARQVVRGAMGLPWDRRQDKVALREMFKGWLPDEYLRAPKVPMKRAEVERDTDGYRSDLIEIFKELFPIGEDVYA